MMNRWKGMVLGGLSSTALLAALLTYYEPSKTPGKPYQDVTGVWTNCLGNTHDVDPKLLYTPQQCKVIDGENQLEDLQTLKEYVTVPLDNGQTAAFADLVHNIGSANFHHSSLLRELNKGNYKIACLKLLDWVYSGGKKSQGLLNRREAEYQMCMAQEEENVWIFKVKGSALRYCSIPNIQPLCDCSYMVAWFL